MFWKFWKKCSDDKAVSKFLQVADKLLPTQDGIIISTEHSLIVSESDRDLFISSKNLQIDNEKRPLNLSETMFKKISPFIIPGKTMENHYNHIGGKKKYTFEEIRLVIFEYISSYHKVFADASESSSNLDVRIYINNLFRQMFNDDKWFSALKVAAKVAAKVAEKNINDVMINRYHRVFKFMFLSFEVDDDIFRSVFQLKGKAHSKQGEDSIKIPIESQIFSLLTVNNNDVSDVNMVAFDFICSAQEYDKLVLSQLYLLGRYVQPFVFSLNQEKIEKMKEKNDKRYVKFVEEFKRGQVEFSKEQSANISQLARALNLIHILLPEINFIIASFCY
jgi:hypothetical protein